MIRHGLAAALCGSLTLVFLGAGPTEFSYRPVGELLPGSGTGLNDQALYLPEMMFPIETTPAYANSQVFGTGGLHGPRGSGQCDPVNYSFPWRDTFCEKRDKPERAPLCPGEVGHQGQDIRPPSCKKDTYWAVSAIDGIVSKIASYSVYVTADDGNTRIDYLHMSNVQVVMKQHVMRGQRLGTVSNAFGNTTTTVHLHLDILKKLPGRGFVIVSPYMSLIRAYERKTTAPLVSVEVANQTQVEIPKLSTRLYKVRPRDSLWLIASERLSSPLEWKTIRKENGDAIPEPDLIFPGQIFLLPR